MGPRVRRKKCHLVDQEDKTGGARIQQEDESSCSTRRRVVLVNLMTRLLVEQEDRSSFLFNETTRLLVETGPDNIIQFQLSWVQITR